MQLNPVERPACIDELHRVVLFDGVCKLCNGWARFLIEHDRAGLFQLASVQSDAGQALLRWAGLPTEYFDTMAYLENGRLWVRSTAVLRVVGQLPAPWSWLGGLRLIPRPLRDGLYDPIARNRYRLFGRHEQCLLPSADHQKRFLHG